MYKLCIDSTMSSNIPQWKKIGDKRKERQVERGHPEKRRRSRAQPSSASDTGAKRRKKPSKITGF